MRLECRGHLLIFVFVADYNIVGIEFNGLAYQQAAAVVGGQQLHFKHVRMLSHHIQCLPSYGACRTEYGYMPFFHQKLIYLVGSTASPLYQSSKWRWSPVLSEPVLPTRAIGEPAVTLSPVFFRSFWLCL